MKIIDNRGQVKKEYTFEDLCVGDYFLDQDGDVSIKFSNDEYLSTMDEGKSWDTCIADGNDKVTPLDVTLTINKEK